MLFAYIDICAADVTDELLLYCPKNQSLYSTGASSSQEVTGSNNTVPDTPVSVNSTDDLALNSSIGKNCSIDYIHVIKLNFITHFMAEDQLILFCILNTQCTKQHNLICCNKMGN